MKHRFAVPYLDGGDMPDVGEWARSHGWYVIEHVWLNDRFELRPGRRTMMTVKLVPSHGAFPDHRVQITASSGATLVYDDADRSMAVTLQPESEDAMPGEPRDSARGIGP